MANQSIRIKAIRVQNDKPSRSTIGIVQDAARSRIAIASKWIQRHLLLILNSACVSSRSEESARFGRQFANHSTGRSLKNALASEEMTVYIAKQLIKLISCDEDGAGESYIDSA
jgi:hypothetical protein